MNLTGTIIAIAPQDSFIKEDGTEIAHTILSIKCDDDYESEIDIDLFDVLTKQKMNVGDRVMAKVVMKRPASKNPAEIAAINLCGAAAIYKIDK